MWALHRKFISLFTYTYIHVLITYQFTTNLYTFPFCYIFILSFKTYSYAYTHIYTYVCVVGCYNNGHIFHEKENFILEEILFRSLLLNRNFLFEYKYMNKNERKCIEKENFLFSFVNTQTFLSST